MATNFVKKCYTVTSRSDIQNGLQYPNFDFRILNRMNFSTLCTILVTVGPVTPEIARVTNARFSPTRQKSTYPTEYLSNCQTDFCQRFSISSHMYGDYKTVIRLMVAQATLLW